MQSGYINQIYKSRNVILDILNKRGYDVTNYEGSGISEVHSMYKNEQLDMLVSKDNKKPKDIQKSINEGEYDTKFT